MLSRLVKIIHAIRHLKPIQLYGQLRNRIVAKMFSSGYWMKRGESVRLGECVWNPACEFLPPGPQRNTTERMKEGFVSFLNVEKQLDWPFDWSSSDHTKLWEYNLHYFEYLFAFEYDDAKQLVLDWIEKHRLARNACGWEPYPVSLRLMNWIANFYGRHRKQTTGDKEFETALKRSLATQAEWLVYRLEYHLLANHYLENAAALAFVGSCFNGCDTKRWFQIGTRILRKELPEQILDDGTHFERSPMYHSRIVYLLKLLSDTGNEELRKTVESFYQRTVTALAKLCHPDGEIALFNDAAFGIYNPPGQFCDFTGLSEAEVFALPNAGYFGARTQNGHYILCDAGEIGPTYNPGHAHGDMFSFELSFFGKRVIVDSGVYNYVVSPERKYSRSTAAHNTVEINGKDQCELFDAFKVAHRARSRDVCFEKMPDGFRLSGWHDGYRGSIATCNRRLPSRAIHQRSFEWNHSGSLEMIDRIEASDEVEAVARFHLHPDCRIVEQKDNEITIGRESILWNMRFSCGNIHVGRYDYSPEFGVKIPANVLEVSFRERTHELKTICRVIG